MVPPARTAPGDEPLSPGPPSPFPSGEPTDAATASSSSSSSSGSPNGGPRARRARRLPAERVSPARRSGLAAAAAAGRRADQRAARSAGHGGHGRRRPGARRVDRGGAGADAASGEDEQPAARVTGDEPPPPAPPPPSSLLPPFLRLAGLGADRRGEGRRAGHRRRGPARGAGLRETGGRAAAIGRLNVAGPRRCKALAYWRAGPRARPSPPRLGGRGGAARSGEHVLVPDAGAGGHELRGGISASDPSRVLRTRMVCRCFPSSGRDREPREAEMRGLVRRAVT